MAETPQSEKTKGKTTEIICGCVDISALHNLSTKESLLAKTYVLTLEYLKQLLVFFPQGKTSACFNTLDFLFLS